MSSRRPSKPSVKTGSKKDAIKGGHKNHTNAAPEELKNILFIPKI